MSRARDSGELLRGEADYQLHLIYVWYEHRPQDAIALLRSLDERYPTNPLFLQRIAETLRHLPSRRRDERCGVADTRRSRSRGRVYDASRIARLAEMKRRAVVAREQKK